MHEHILYVCLLVDKSLRLTYHNKYFTFNTTALTYTPDTKNKILGDQINQINFFK